MYEELQRLAQGEPTTLSVEDIAQYALRVVDSAVPHLKQTAEAEARQSKCVRANADDSINWLDCLYRLPDPRTLLRTAEFARPSGRPYPSAEMMD